MYLPANYNFFCPMKTNSGNKALENLPVELDALDARKPLILGSAKDVAKGMLRQVTKAFSGSGITLGVFDEIADQPDLDTVKQVADLYRRNNHDAIIAVGGGPAAHSAKAVNLLVSGTSGDLKRFTKANSITAPLKPYVLALGARSDGYETSGHLEVEDLAITSEFLMPDLAVVDTRLLLAQKTEQTVASAMIALTHAVEASISPDKNPLIDAYAFGAVNFIVEHLSDAIADPGDRDHALALANAAAMAGCAFANASVGLTHRLAQALSATGDLAPGIAMAILLPYGVEHVHLSRSDAQTGDLLLALGGFGLYAATPPELRPAKVFSALYELQTDVHEDSDGKIPRTLEDAGFAKGDLNDIARQAAKNVNGLTIKACNEVLVHAYEGQPLV